MGRIDAVSIKNLIHASGIDLVAWSKQPLDCRRMLMISPQGGSIIKRTLKSKVIKKRYDYEFKGKQD